MCTQHQGAIIKYQGGDLQNIQCENSCANGDGDGGKGEMQIRDVVNIKIFKTILNEKRID